MVRVTIVQPLHTSLIRESRCTGKSIIQVGSETWNKSLRKRKLIPSLLESYSSPTIQINIHSYLNKQYWNMEHSNSFYKSKSLQNIIQNKNPIDSYDIFCILYSHSCIIDLCKVARWCHFRKVIQYKHYSPQHHSTPQRGKCEPHIAEM